MSPARESRILAPDRAARNWLFADPPNVVREGWPAAPHRSSGIVSPLTAVPDGTVRFRRAGLPSSIQLGASSFQHRQPSGFPFTTCGRLYDLTSHRDHGLHGWLLPTHPSPASRGGVMILRRRASRPQSNLDTEGESFADAPEILRSHAPACPRSGLETETHSAFLPPIRA